MKFAKRGLTRSNVIFLILLATTTLIISIVTFYNVPEFLIHKELNIEEIEKIEVWDAYTNETYTLNDEEVMEFVNAFNSAEYIGFDTSGVGLGSDKVVSVYFEDGMSVMVLKSADNGEILVEKVTGFGWMSYWIESEELETLFAN